MIWPDQLWFWIIAYGLWNFAAAIILYDSSIAVFVYHFGRILMHKKNPLKDEIYTDLSGYQEIIKLNQHV